MLGNTYDTQVCSIARALELVGERWTLLILRNALFADSTRYSHFQRSLGISTNILKDRLDGLVDAGIMRRQRYSEQPELHEYLLTERVATLRLRSSRLPSGAIAGPLPMGPRSSTPTLRAAQESVTRSCARRTVASATTPRFSALPGPGMPADRAERINKRLAARLESGRIAVP